jgi:acyl-CoA thioesterase FadM
MLEPFTVDFRTVATSLDGRRFKVRNRFTTEAHGLCATVDSVGMWLDLAGRRSIVAPVDRAAGRPAPGLRRVGAI